MFATVIVGIILATVMFFAIRSMVKRHKGGCSCGCEGCRGCSNSAIRSK